MIQHELECPMCKHKFILTEDYLSGYCPNCEKTYYYWDETYNEELNITYDEGYYWD